VTIIPHGWSRTAAALSVLGLASLPARAQGTLPITKLASDVYLIVAPSGNMVAQATPTGIVVVGAQSRASTPAVVATLRTVSAAPIRYVIFAPGDSMGDEGDAGWSERNTTIVAHERMKMTAPNVVSALGFSEVLQIYLDGQSLHAVHQPPGHTRADIIAHFETRRILYLGNAFVAKGYPRIDVQSGASIDSLIKEVAPFAGFNGVQIVPGRGPVSTAADVGAYREMLQGVRDKVAALVAQKKPLAQVIGAKPTASWDATYARGGVLPERFVESVYASLKPNQP
jgi:glyoxylase-like metal-dependent hydrolase (beta-lactamase superfamily II)